MASPPNQDSLDVATLCKELGGVESKLAKFGTLLGVPYPKLKEFEKESYPLAALFDYCVKDNLKNKFTWESVYDALKCIGESELAETISKKYCQEKQNGTRKEDQSHKQILPSHEGGNLDSKGTTQNDGLDSGCYLFINGTNLWRGGKVASAKMLSLLDSNTDHRYRIDFEKLVTLITKGRKRLGAYFYGLEPQAGTKKKLHKSKSPPVSTMEEENSMTAKEIDSYEVEPLAGARTKVHRSRPQQVLTAAKEHGFKIRLFKHSKAKHNIIDVAMATEIRNTIHHAQDAQEKESIVFIVVTANIELCPQISAALIQDIPVELWSWESTAHEFSQLAQASNFFTANSLDRHLREFSYTEYINLDREINPESSNAVVYRDVPDSESFECELTDYLQHLKHIFYIIPVGSQKRDIIVEFPNAKFDVLKKLQEFGGFSYQLCSYLDYYRYQHRSTQSSKPLRLTNRFQALSEVNGKGKPTSIGDLDPDTQRDLRRQLDYKRKKIKEKYASFAVSLSEAIEATDVNVNKFRLQVLGLSAFENEYEGEQPIVVDEVKTKIENADSIHKIFEILTTDCCSFMNIGIFQSIIDIYSIDTDSSTDLQYPKHLQDYLYGHTIAEFVQINPKLEKIKPGQNELVLKFNIKLPSKVSKVLDLKSAIADILQLKSYTLRLVSIEEGCVIVTFHIPTTVATCIFSNGLTEDQEAKIRALSVLWMKCGDYKLEKLPQASKHQTASQSKHLVDKSEAALDLITICKELLTLQDKWNEIGAKFGIPDKKLMAMAGDNPLIPVFRSLLDSSEVSLTWSSIVDVLKSKEVGEPEVAETIYKKYCQPKRNIKEDQGRGHCYIFVDHSNIWIGGQTARAIHKKYKNATRDSRFRIEYGKLLMLVANRRKIVKVYRYGDKLPSVSGIERRKIADSPFTSEMEERIMKTENTENSVFIILTGDDSLLPAINHILNQGTPVELWTWNHAMATKFKTLAYSNFKAYYFDNVPLEKFGFIEYMYKSNSAIPISYENAIECTVPTGKIPRKEILDYFERKHLLVYIRSQAIPGDEPHQKLVIEIPDTDPQIILDIPQDFKYVFKKSAPI